jgi:Flp pilus assembly protein TadD
MQVVLAAGVAGVGGALLVGCSGSDMITFSQDAKREGIKQYNSGDYVDAAGSFRSAVRQDPRDYESYWYLGASKEQIKDYHGAILAYKTSLDVMGQTMGGRSDAATKEKVLDRMAHLIAAGDEAETQINGLVAEAQQRHSADDYRLLGRTFRYRGDADSAVDQYRRGLHFAQDDFGYHKEFGLYLAQLGQNADASRVLRDAYELDETDVQVNLALAKLGVSHESLAKRGVEPSDITPAPGATPARPSVVDAPRD